MKTSHNTKDPSELCTICEININVPSAELGPTVCTDTHTHTHTHTHKQKKRVALFYVVLETLRRQCSDFLQQQEKNCSSIYIWVIIQSLPHTNALDDEGFSVVYWETLSWKVGKISQRVFLCVRWYQRQWLSCSVWLENQLALELRWGVWFFILFFFFFFSLPGVL